MKGDRDWKDGKYIWIPLSYRTGNGKITYGRDGKWEDKLWERWKMGSDVVGEMGNKKVVRAGYWQNSKWERRELTRRWFHCNKK